MVALIVTGSVLLHRGSPAPLTQKPRPRLETVPVERMTLTDSQTVTGQLGYGRSSVIRGDRAGTVTRLPSSGAVVTRGEQLLRVDDESVRLFYGATPFYRDLDRVGLVGRDVRVLNDNLAALGYSTGRQPAVGTRVPQGSATPPPVRGAAGTDRAENPESNEEKENSTSRTPRTIEVRPGDAVLTRR